MLILSDERTLKFISPKNGIRASGSCGLNKGCNSKFRVGSQVRQETIEEGQRTYQTKMWINLLYSSLTDQSKLVTSPLESDIPILFHKKQCQKSH